MIMRQLILIFLILLLLSGCAAPAPETPEASFAPSAAPAAADAGPSVLVLRDFSDDDAAAMARFMGRGRWLRDGDMLYGMDYDASWRPALVCYRYRHGSLSGFQLLAEDCVPEYLCLGDGCLYYLSGGAIERCELSSRRRERLSEGPCGSLQFFDGQLYYTDGEGRYCRCAADGSGAEVLIEGPCDYAYAMAEGVIYQSEKDGCTLRMRLWDGADRQLTAAASYAPLRLGSTVWYSQKDELGAAIASVDLRDGSVRRYESPAMRGSAELIGDGGGWALRLALSCDGWRQQILHPGESEGRPCAYSGYRLCDYTEKTLRIDAAYEADGRLRCFVLVDEKGGELRFVGGETLD